MKQELSILIPIYGCKPHQLVKQLCEQASHTSGLKDYEVVVVDDGTPDAAIVESCWVIGQWPHCRFMALEENIGRSRIRNLLASLARFEWLLYLDCDMTIDRQDFLANYLNCNEGDVACGGVSIGPGDPGNLRWLYESTAAAEHSVAERKKRPYQDFHTANFLVHRDIMKAHPFDTRFKHYGYEDVLFGKQLNQAGIPIVHIDNPAGFYTFEDNARFVDKTEEGLRTLREFRNELRGYSRLLTLAEGIHLAPVRWMLRLYFRLCAPLMRRNLCGTRPSLSLFRLYKIGYYLNLQ